MVVLRRRQRVLLLLPCMPLATFRAWFCLLALPAPMLPLTLLPVLLQVPLPLPCLMLVRPCLCIMDVTALMLPSVLPVLMGHVLWLPS